MPQSEQTKYLETELQSDAHFPHEPKSMGDVELDESYSKLEGGESDTIVIQHNLLSGIDQRSSNNYWESEKYKQAS